MASPPSERCEVEAYSGARYGERPRAFTCRGRRYEIAAIERSWRTPAGPRFLVRTTADLRFRLDYDESEDVWRLSAYENTA